MGVPLKHEGFLAMEINMLHPDYDDEDSAVAKSVEELKKIAQSPTYTACHIKVPKKGWRHKCCSKKTVPQSERFFDNHYKCPDGLGDILFYWDSELFSR